MSLVLVLPGKEEEQLKSGREEGRSGASFAEATKGRHWWPRTGGERGQHSRPNPSQSVEPLRSGGVFAAESVRVVAELPDSRPNRWDKR